MTLFNSPLGLGSEVPPSIFGILFNLSSSFFVNSIVFIPIFLSMLGISPFICPINASNKCSTFISELLYLTAKLWASERASILFCVNFSSISINLLVFQIFHCFYILYYKVRYSTNLLLSLFFKLLALFFIGC